MCCQQQREILGFVVGEACTGAHATTCKVTWMVSDHHDYVHYMQHTVVTIFGTFNAETITAGRVCTELQATPKSV